MRRTIWCSKIGLEIVVILRVAVLQYAIDYLVLDKLLRNSRHITSTRISPSTVFERLFGAQKAFFK